MELPKIDKSTLELQQATLALRKTVTKLSAAGIDNLMLITALMKLANERVAKVEPPKGQAAVRSLFAQSFNENRV